MSKLLNLSTFLVLTLLLLSPLAVAAQLQLVKVSDIRPGDTFIDPKSGEEVQVETIQESDYNFLTNLKDILTGKSILTGMVTGGLAPITGNSILLSGSASALQNTVGQLGIEAAKGAATSTLQPGAFGAEYFGIKPLEAGSHSNFLSLTAGGGWDALVSGAQWGAIAYVAGQLLGPMIGLDDAQTDSLSMSLAAGFGVGKLVAVGAQSGGFLTGSSAGILQGLGSGAGWGPLGLLNTAPGIGIAVAVIVFIATYEDVEYKEVSFSCQPYQAPSGGNNCEVCNDDDLPCSEYRCKSLGQACELVNQGTSDESCVYAHPNDVTPPVITPNKDLLDDDYYFDNVKLSPPGPGFEIKYQHSSDKCIPAFTPLEFTIDTDEPSQCMIDFEHTENFGEMKYLFGNSNLYEYQHTERFSLPGPGNLNRENLTIENDGKWEFYIRCKDVNGNENVADYALKFCVDPSPDTTPPLVVATSVENGNCVAEHISPANVTFFLNEPGQCKWDYTNQNYEDMENSMQCNDRLEQMNSQQLYPCKAPLGGITRAGTDYYIRCRDIAEIPNEMATSFDFSLRSSTALLIQDLQPNKTVFGVVDPAPVELYVKTGFGCNDNRAICAYSFSGDEGDYNIFYDTDTEDGIHTQRLDLTEGRKEIFIRCADEGGNVAEDRLNFDVEIDANAPIIARIYEEADMLKILTTRDSTCAYTNEDCNFLIEEGIEMPYSNSTAHVTEWNKDETYFIKCEDDFRKEEAACSVTVKPTDNFL